MSPDETRGYTLHDIRKFCLWGTLMAGGGGVEYYFGYQLPENDLVCEDFRSRECTQASLIAAIACREMTARPRTS